MKLEKWEVKAGLTSEVKKAIFEQVTAKFRDAMGNVGDYFDIECNTSDYRHDDGECALSVHINNNPEHLEPNNAYFEVTWEKDGEVTLMLGEDGDIEWALTPGNLWSLMYCQAFCKPE